MRFGPIALFGALLVACAGGKPEPTPIEPPPTPQVDAQVAAPEPPPPPPPDPLRHQPDLPEENRLLVVIDGQERIVDRAAARDAGYEEIDFSDSWTPMLFAPRTGIDGQPKPNRYRKIFLGLANDLTDGDGRPLKKDERNYLEVFGIPPSMGLVWQRFVEDADSECLKTVDFDLLKSVPNISYRSKAKRARHQRKLRRFRRLIKKAMKKAKTDDLVELKLSHPKLSDEIDYVMEHEQQMRALTEVEKRLACDGHNHARYRHKAGRLDDGLLHAVRRFQRKNKIYSYSNLRPETMRHFAMLPEENNYLTFLRVLEERIVSSTGILEDGTAQEHPMKLSEYRDTSGQVRPTRNLVSEFVQATLSQLSMDDSQKALAFFKRRSRDDFRWLRVGVKFPKRPPYYSDNMDLKLVIDRGTVWYDLPWNEETGKKRRQRRTQMPRATLFVRYNEQDIPLVHWPTTIGGWRKDLAPNGYVYMKYKGSDVGDRVMRKIIAGPTWIPPESTPISSLAKRRYVRGKRQGVVNYAEMGPGYLSAYGLVAGYFVIPGTNGRGDHDRGIRAHGSSDYMSIMSQRRFSHGCHRLMNHHAVRLYTFILSHRPHTVPGDQAMNYKRQFLHKDEVYEMRVPTRGFQYTLDPPVPVTVLEGKIKGKAEEPFEGYFKIPGEEYPSLMPGEESESPADNSSDTEGCGVIRLFVSVVVVSVLFLWAAHAQKPAGEGWSRVRLHPRLPPSKLSFAPSLASFERWCSMAKKNWAQPLSSMSSRGTQGQWIWWSRRRDTSR